MLHGSLFVVSGINLKEVVKGKCGAKFVELRLILENRCDVIGKRIFFLLGPGQLRNLKAKLCSFEPGQNIFF